MSTVRLVVVVLLGVARGERGVGVARGERGVGMAGGLRGGMGGRWGLRADSWVVLVLGGVLGVGGSREYPSPLRCAARWGSTGTRAWGLTRFDCSI